MRVNACDVRFEVCVPILHWHCKVLQRVLLVSRKLCSSVLITNKEELSGYLYIKFDLW